MPREPRSIPRQALPLWRNFSDERLRAATEPDGTVRDERLKILIVEDNPLLSMQIEDAFMDAGFDVVGKATSAAQAIAFARQTRPDIIIVDIRLEGDRDGIDAATDIRAELGIRSVFASSFSAND